MSTPCADFMTALLREAQSSGVDRMPEQAIGAMARHFRVSRADAEREFMAACVRLHVERWPLGLTADEYRAESRRRYGTVNVWAAVLRVGGVA